MITPVKPKSPAVLKYQQEKNSVFFESEKETLRITFFDKDIVRVSVTQDDERRFNPLQGNEILNSAEEIQFSISEDDDAYTIDDGYLKVYVCRKTGSIQFVREGKILFAEDAENPHVTERFDVYRTCGEIKTEEIKTADGVKKRITSADREYDKTLCHTRLNCTFKDGEKLYGLGQHEEGLWNLRGNEVYLNQGNLKIAIPYLVSSYGYGIYFSTQSASIFCDTKYGSYFYTDADYFLDYFFIAPPKKNLLTEKMRRLTGKALHMPEWVFGYIQSQERYETQEEILATADEFAKRGIPLSTIVLDWLSWEDGMWGQKSFDAKRFPDPKGMVQKLHEKNIRFMISIWPSMDEKCSNYAEMKKNGCLLNGINICNVFDKKGRDLYWKQTDEGLAVHGIDAWWCDSSEPLTPEWNHSEKPVPQVQFAEYLKATSDVMSPEKANAYGYYHSMGIFDGMTKTYPERPVVNLTRSGYPGSQKYGVIVWSGDTSAKWQTLSNQVVQAVQFSLSGLPYWTVDIGGFFVKKGLQWYWNGDYDDTVSNNAFCELYTRWVQFAAFLPVFRAHGTDCRREPWAFEKTGTDSVPDFYGIIVDFIKLRYRLMPYILGVEKRICENDEQFIRPLFTEFDDPVCEEICTQYMFGPSMMVCPVTKPMYFNRDGSRAAECDRQIKVYLPGGTEWTDFWTGRKLCGGQWIMADADIAKIPVFVTQDYDEKSLGVN